MALVIYNTKDGSPLMIQETDDTNIYASVSVEIPKGKQIVGINPKTKEPIFEDRPLTLEERLAILESSQNDQDEAINDLASMMGE